MVAADEEADYFAIMGLAPGASEAEIRKAYRKLSLALHPDKNRHMEPKMAAARFSEMQLAYEVLMDPAARLAAEERNKAETARKERRGAYEGKRKAMAEELEKREEQEKQKRYKAAQEERSRKATLERLREEGKRLREQREQEAREKLAQQQSRPGAKDGTSQSTNAAQNGHARSDKDELESRSTPPPELGPLDLTVTLRFPAEQYNDLAASSETGSSPLDSRLARALSARFGKLDSLIMRPPKPAAEGKSHRKEATAHATFTTLDAAFHAVKAGSQLNAGGPGEAALLDDVWIGWAAAPKKGKLDAVSAVGGMPGEPARIAWMRQRGKLGRTAPAPPAGGNGEAPRALDEKDVLRRLMAHKTTQYSGDTEGAANECRPSAFPSFNFNPSSTSNASAAAASSKTNGGASLSDNFESATLRRMREAERRRVEEAIVKADEQE